jgi:hypothetical protein
VIKLIAADLIVPNLIVPNLIVLWASALPNTKTALPMPP